MCAVNPLPSHVQLYQKIAHGIQHHGSGYKPEPLPHAHPAQDHPAHDEDGPVLAEVLERLLAGPAVGEVGGWHVVCLFVLCVGWVGATVFIA